MSSTPSSSVPPVAHRWRRVRWLLAAGLVLAVMLVVLRQPLLRGAAHLWIVEASPFAPVDAVVVNASGRHSILDRSAQWVRDGQATRMILLRGETRATDRAGITPPILETRLRQLTEQGVPESARVLVGEELLTYHAEVSTLAAWARSHAVGPVIFPVEPFATRRVARLARRVLAPAGVRATVVPVAVPEYDVDRWWQSKEGLLAFEKECVLALYYWWRY